jgi:predicted MPP superfamily phosphohydrolase
MTTPAPPPEPRRRLLTRRRFVLAAGLGAVGVVGYTFRIGPHHLQVVRRDMPVPDLPPELDGRTLAQVSDLHVGPHVDADYLAGALRKVSSLSPDIVAVTGDFMSLGNAARLDEVARVMENLTPPPLGCFAALGNHDYGEQWRDADLAERLSHRLTNGGVRVLRNEAADVSGLTLVGLDDLWSPNFRPEAVLAGVRADAPAVVLCHNPDAADRPVWSKFRGWILSGHTHGGQCKPPFLPPPLLPVANRRYTSGAFDLGGGRRMYINRGLGHLTKVRFNCRPEITLFRLVRAA